MAIGRFQREPKADPRARRNSQGLTNFPTRGGVTQDGEGYLTLDLAANAGLVQTAGLTINLQTNGGLGLTSNELHVVEGEIDHDSLLNFVANEHIDWTSTTEDLSTSGSISGGAIDGTSLVIGDGTNEAAIDGDGDLSFAGTARIDWTKITADNITLTAGTSASAASDLQTHADGNFYHIDEAAATPGIHLEVEFVSVTAFNWVHVVAQYDGLTTHGVALQLYNFSTTTWDTFDSIETGYADVSTAGGYILGDHSFFVPDDSNYIGTGGDAGDVRVRFYHTPAGNSAHDLDIDVVALYQ